MKKLLENKQIMICVTILFFGYFIYRFYRFGLKTDFILAWTKEVDIFWKIIIVGLILSFGSILIVIILKKHDTLKMLVIVATIVLLLVSIFLTPNWEYISIQQEKNSKEILYKEHIWEDVIEKVNKKNEYFLIKAKTIERNNRAI